ncbi:MAG TPA: HD domain-containing protein [Herpetosiphonaceae bacterium]|nr:HD domain-containing protein [Herpetosiphonaceae bacterium]
MIGQPLTARQEQVVAATVHHVRGLLDGEGTGHDWWHIERVWRLAIHIGQAEDADPFVVTLAALLHDIADWKFHGGDLDAGPRAARAWLRSQNVDESVVDHVCAVVAQVSFKGALVPDAPGSREAMVVQDADRLDALGAIGIARAFAYGGSQNRSLYDPRVIPNAHVSFEAYRASRGTTINHFHEKLLLLRDRMHTPTARAIAAERHEFMVQFLERFLAEWEGR